MDETGDFYKDEAFRYLREGYEKQMSGELQEAMSLYRKSLEIHPTAEAHTFLGWAYGNEGHYKDAINECRKAIETDPEYGNPYNDIGYYLIEQEKFDEAIPWLEKAIGAKRYDSYYYPHYNLGRVWEHKAQWAKAMAAYSEALRFNPEYRLAAEAVKRLQGMLN